MGRISDRFNLEKQVTFYMSYHHDKMNQLIHFMCIWPLLITAIALTANTNAFIEQPEFLKGLPYSEYMIMNLSAVVAAVYMTWYILLDIWAGTIGAVLVFASYIFGNYLVVHIPTVYNMEAWHIVLPIHVIAWVLQFIGHGVFEHRAPALFDSFDQALITAPMFVLIEFLFLLGFRADLYNRVMKQVEINVAAFHGKSL